MILGLLNKLINFALLSLAVFDQFDTFPGVDGWGWVGGWGKIKNKDPLSPAEAETGAELGKKCSQKRRSHSECSNKDILIILSTSLTQVEA